MGNKERRHDGCDCNSSKQCNSGCNCTASEGTGALAALPDDFATMDDYELTACLHTLEEGKLKAFNEGKGTTRQWEEKLAYVQRELQLRQTRRSCNVEYNKKINDAMCSRLN